MSEATPAGDQHPAAQASSGTDPADAASVPLFDLEDLTAGEIELMETYVGEPVLPLLVTMLEAIADSGGNPWDVVRVVPFKLMVAVAGVGRLKADPEFTPDVWPSIRFMDLFPRAEPGEPAMESEAADPSSPAAATGGPSAKPQVTPTPLEPRRGKRASRSKPAAT